VFLLSVANLSGLLGDMFRYTYSRVLCRFYYSSKKKKELTIDIDYMNNAAIETVIHYEKIDSGFNFNDPTFDGHFDSIKNSQGVATKKIQEINKNVIIQDELNKDIDADNRVSVPLTVSMLILTSYLIIGAAIVNSFETWGLVTAAYFCFVSVSTIGKIVCLFNHAFHDPTACFIPRLW
jgi:hypothetical protein